jgi:hypothetical protein
MTLHTTDIQPRTNCLQRFSHDYQAPLCDLRMNFGVLGSTLNKFMCIPVYL